MEKFSCSGPLTHCKWSCLQYTHTMCGDGIFIFVIVYRDYATAFRSCGASTFPVAMRRQTGKIQAYGMATWSCFRAPLGDPGHLSLQEVWDIAAKVGGKNHGFRHVKWNLFPAPCCGTRPCLAA